jgi:hypothetical protein
VTSLKVSGISNLSPHKLVRQVKLSLHASIVGVVKNSRQTAFFDLQSHAKLSKFLNFSVFVLSQLMKVEDICIRFFGVQWVTVSRLEKRTSGKN